MRRRRFCFFLVKTVYFLLARDDHHSGCKCLGTCVINQAKASDPNINHFLRLSHFLSLSLFLIQHPSFSHTHSLYLYLTHSLSISLTHTHTFSLSCLCMPSILRRFTLKLLHLRRKGKKKIEIALLLKQEEEVICNKRDLFIFSNKSLSLLFHCRERFNCRH